MKHNKILVITCAAIAREINEIKKFKQWSEMDLQAITADLHATPHLIPQAVASKVDAAKENYSDIYVAYGDCGTSGDLDKVLEERGVERLAGAHCYDFLAGEKSFEELQEEEPGTFYLTDFLTQHFDRLVISMLGLDRHPDLLELYFGNYTRLVYLAQTESPELTAQAKQAAERLNLKFERIFTGNGLMEPMLDNKMKEFMSRRHG